MQTTFATPVLQAIKTRRSIRRYTPERVPRLVLETLLDAAIWSPSAHNRQPWRFAAITEAGTQERLARAMGAQLRADLSVDHAPPELIEKDAARSWSRITGAGALIVVCLSMAEMDRYPDAQRSRNEYLMAVQSVAMAAQNLLLAAHEMDLGGCWMCAPLFCQPTVRAALDLPDDWEPQALITLGYPAETKTKTREPLESRVVWR